MNQRVSERVDQLLAKGWTDAQAIAQAVAENTGTGGYGQREAWTYGQREAWTYGQREAWTYGQAS